MCWWSFMLTQHQCVEFNTLTGCSCLLIFSALRNRQCTRMYACAVHPVYTYVNTCSVVCVCTRVFELEEALCPVVQYRQKVDEILSLPTLVEFQVICAWSYHVLCILSVRIAGRNIFVRFLWKKKKKKGRAEIRGIINDKRAYNTRYTFVGRFRFIIFAAAFLSRFQLSYGIYATIFYHAWTSCTVINYKSIRHRTKQREIARNLRSEFQENTQRILV